MLAFRCCRIVATLYHRAFFLLLADFLAGRRWFFVNSFAALVDVIFSPSHDYLLTLTDPWTVLAGVGFCLCWWMAHFLCTKQMWFNGVIIELFLLVLFLGQLSNLAFTTSNSVLPVLIAASLYFLIDYYRYYINQLRIQDPEQFFYRLSQLRRPFVPRRALQLIQLIPILYTVLHLTRPFFADITYFRTKYFVGMAEATVYFFINLDFGLAALTRVVGTVRHVQQHYSWKNMGYFFRFNMTGSYSIHLRDVGWSSIPSDQLQLSWIIYWIFKVIIISFLWINDQQQPYFHFLVQELLGNFVAATATVYLLCLLVGFLLASISAMFTLTADIMACSSVCQGSYDTIQHVRWLSLTSLLCPHNKFNLIHQISYAYLPLCGHMIQNIGEAVRRRCFCDAQSWLSAFGGILAILIYLTVSIGIYLFVIIGIPHVSHCFAYVTEMSALIWLGYIAIMTLVELVTIIVYQGLADDMSKQNLDLGTKIFRNCMAGVMVILLSAVNVVSLVQAHKAALTFSPCGYRSVIHNVLQIVSRIVFFYATITNQNHAIAPLGASCHTDSVVLQRTWNPHDGVVDYPACGLCYSGPDIGNLLALECGHSFHKKCFKTWKNYGTRCPVCRALFRRAVIQQAYEEDRECE